MKTALRFGVWLLVAAVVILADRVCIAQPPHSNPAELPKRIAERVVPQLEALGFFPATEGAPLNFSGADNLSVQIADHRYRHRERRVAVGTVPNLRQQVVEGKRRYVRTGNQSELTEDPGLLQIHLGFAQRDDLELRGPPEWDPRPGRWYLRLDERRGEVVSSERGEAVGRRTLRDAEFHGLAGQIRIEAIQGQMPGIVAYHFDQDGKWKGALNEFVDIERATDIRAVFHYEHQPGTQSPLRVSVHARNSIISHSLPAIDEAKVVELMQLFAAAILEDAGWQPPGDAPDPLATREPDEEPDAESQETLGWVLHEVKIHPEEGEKTDEYRGVGLDWWLARQVEVTRGDGKARIVVRLDYYSVAPRPREIVIGPPEPPRVPGTPREGENHLGRYAGAAEFAEPPAVLVPGRPFTVQVRGGLNAGRRLEQHHRYWDGLDYKLDGTQGTVPMYAPQGSDERGEARRNQQATLEEPRTEFEAEFMPPQPPEPDSLLVQRLREGQVPEVHIEALASFEPTQTPNVTWIYRLGPIEAPPIEPHPTQLAIYDANPRFTQRADIERAPAEELLRQVTTVREGVVADGVSRLLLVAEVDRSGMIEFTTEARRGVSAGVTETDPVKREEQFRQRNDILSARDGRFRTLLNGRTVEIDDRHYGFALYTPPGQFDFDDRPAAGTWKHEVHFREVPFQVRLDPAGQSPQVSEHRLLVARPPVVLVHGTFDNRRNCWQLSAADAPAEVKHGTFSMEAYLQRRGFVVRLVDYEQSNGTWTARGADRSGFTDNARVLWENPGGIREALDYYRGELNLAATRADVVGHSLGGLIARLWASEQYNPNGYLRDDNFQSGDIRRLITIGTPHHGSDLSELIDIFQRQQAEGGLRERAVSSIALQYMQWSEGTALTAAVRDQLPHPQHETSQPRLPTPLQQIGPTAVPAHAIVGIASAGDLRDFGRAYQDRLRTIWRVFTYQPRTLRAFLEERGQEDQIEQFHGVLAEQADRQQGWLTEAQPMHIRDEALLMHLLRGAVFGKQQADMTVRVESQTGGLPLHHTTLIRGTLHSYQPRYEKVQQRVAELLAGGDWLFYADGFPEAGAKLLNVRSLDFQQDPAERRRAIQLGGMVPAQAEAFSLVARKRNEIVIVRPVNHHATSLIAANQATKDMHVKGKSSSWGPQAGYIASEQRFSKLWFAKQDRDEEIEKYDQEVVKCLADRRAQTVELSVNAGGELYDVRVIAGEPDAIRAVVLRQRRSGEYFHWQNDGENFSPENEPTHWPFADARDETTEPMLVLADRFSGLPLTADYDLLGVATPIRGPPPESPVFDPEMGYVTPRQKELILQLNYAVRLHANYAGGNVTHHGPEKYYPGSPGVDFPLTAFEPDGTIRSIPEGSEGQLDLHVKMYFHQQRQLGWQIEPNPVWMWGEYDTDLYPQTGWQPQDDPNDRRRRKEEGQVRPADDPFDSHEGGRWPQAVPFPPSQLLVPTGGTR